MPKLKANVGLDAVRGLKTISEIAQAYGVHLQLVGQWKKEILESAYVRLACRFAYLVVVINWYSRKVLSWRFSNSMDVLF